MSDRRIVVTGANGYLGRRLVPAYAAAGVDVTAISRRPTNAFESLPNVRTEVIDIFDPKQAQRLDRILAYSDILAHFAWHDGFVLNSPEHPRNVSSHYMFLERAAALGVSRIVAAGSMHEIGYWEGAVTASTPTNPTNLYGIAKGALRQFLLTTYADAEVEVQWVRMFYITGHDRESNSIFGKILAAADRGETTFPFTTGTTAYDFIDVDDLARQIVIASLTPGVTGIINCCTGAPTSLADRVERFISENRLDITLEYGAYPDRPGDSPAIWGDATSINRIISGYKG